MKSEYYLMCGRIKKTLFLFLFLDTDYNIFVNKHEYPGCVYPINTMCISNGVGANHATQTF